jgi:hypothetical protein
MAKLNIYKYVRTDKGWRFRKAAFHPNGKIKPNVEAVTSEVTKYLSLIGRQGRRSRSADKSAAISANLKKAQAARRKYPRCPRYKYRSHRFSRATGRCACGHIKPVPGT